MSEEEATKVHLYRAVLKEKHPDGTVVNGKHAPGVLYPDFDDRPLPDGRVRPADVKLSADREWVYAGGGTSLFDKPDVFKGNKWLSFTIPEGTSIPHALVIPFTGHNKRFGADHYQIECRAGRMRADAYRGALDNLARSSIVRAIELATATNKE